MTVLAIFLVSLVVAWWLVSKMYNLWMHITGASVMFFNPKIKLLLIFVVATILSGLVVQTLGIEIPKTH